MGLIRVTDSSTEPVSLTEAKLHLRVSSTDDDTLIGGLITAARQHVESVTGRALMSQTWRLSMDSFPAVIEVPRPPFRAVTSLAYYDSNGSSQTLGSTAYQLDSDSLFARIAPAYNTSWPTTRAQQNAVLLTYTAGTTTASSVPAPLVAAIMLLIGNWYENREAVTVGASVADLPHGVESLLSPYRVMEVSCV